MTVMIDDVTARQNIERLNERVKKLRRVANTVSIQCFVASILPMSRARAGLKARHAALVKMVDEARAEIERLHEVRS
jgi:hypothetical protein